MYEKQNGSFTDSGVGRIAHPCMSCVIFDFGRDLPFPGFLYMNSGDNVLSHVTAVTTPSTMISDETVSSAKVMDPREPREIDGIKSATDAMAIKDDKRIDRFNFISA